MKNKKHAMKLLKDDIRRNSGFKETLEYLALAINTPEKSELAVKCLRGTNVADELSKPAIIALVNLEEDLDVTEESTRKCDLHEALADLCRHLGSPDNCRIALCAIHHTLRGSFDTIVERDAGPVDWCFMWSIRRCIDKIVESLAVAKLADAVGKED